MSANKTPIPDKAGFTRHPQAIELDKWLESVEGRNCLSALGSVAWEQYLRNRLIRAFQAGWDAHEQHVAPSNGEAR